MDIDGSGRMSVVQRRQGLPSGFWRRDAVAEDWEEFRSFAEVPTIPFDDQHVHFVDLDGDGIADSLYDQGKRWLITPFGTSAYRAVDSTIEVSPKRYRYAAAERDEETGLDHMGLRYYAPWLGRWTSADPIGLGDGVNRYAYVHGNPVSMRDPGGTRTMPGILEGGRPSPTRKASPTSC